jgi:hypothetical protein
MKIIQSTVQEYAKIVVDSRQFLDVNVILTFNNEDDLGNSQDIFDLKLPINKYDESAILFFHQNFFKEIVKKCQLIGRNTGDLIKISTCSNWGLYETVTGQDSLTDLGHSCKWYFGKGREDLDLWELALTKLYGFGEDADMSRVNDF